MRRTYSSISPKVVYQHASKILQQVFPWKSFKRSVTREQMVDMLLLMASLCSSLSNVVKRFFDFSDETGRKALQENLPGNAQRGTALVVTLYDVANFSRPDRRPEWHIKATHEKVRTRVVLWKGSLKTMLFAFDGWDDHRAKNVHQQAVTARHVYQRRFGIETSYRQKNQAEANTTSSHSVYRLLLQGIAYLLRQIWVVLREQLARSKQKRHDDRDESFTVARMLDWLADELKGVHQEDRAIPLLD